MIFAPSQVFSTVNTSWDWELIDGKPKTIVIWCLENRTADNGLPNGDSWMQVLSTAAQMWNDANTGWTFKPTSEGTDNEGKLDRTCQVVLAVMDHNSKGGAKADRGYLNANGTGPVKRIRIAVDPTPISNDRNHPGPTTWDIENGLDPVDVIAHELGHTLRLTHPTDRLGSPNMMDPRRVGAHLEGLSQNDTDEAKASIDRVHHPRTTNQTVVNRADHNCSTPFPIFDSEGMFLSSNFVIDIPPQDLDGNIPMTCSPFFAYVPNMDNVPTGVNPMIIAFEVNSSLQTLQQPATIRIPYADSILQDPEFYPYNGIDPSLLKAYFMSSDGRWQQVTGLQNLDTVNKVISFQVSDLTPKFFGITGVEGPGQLGDLAGSGGVTSIGRLPSWIKNTALYWSEGQTSDHEYALSIGWLISYGAINLESSGSHGSTVEVPQGIHLPSWIKNNANWWAKSSIDDTTYLTSLKYMLDNNIITFAKSSSPQTNTGTPTIPKTLPTTPVPQEQNQVTETAKLALPQKLVLEATSSSGTPVPYTASATYSISGVATPSCDHQSGTIFPIGRTIVTCTATNPEGKNPIKGSFTVTVQDTTPPVIAPFQPHNDTPDSTGAVVYFTSSATDVVDGPVEPHCNYQSGTKFPIGVSTITCTAQDLRGNHSSRSLQISITLS